MWKKWNYPVALTFNVTIYQRFKLQMMSWKLSFSKVISLQILDFCCKMRLLRMLTPSLTPAIDVLIKQSQSVIIRGQVGNYMQTISDNTLIKSDKSVKLKCCCLHKQEFTFNRSPQLTIIFALRSLTRIKLAGGQLSRVPMTCTHQRRLIQTDGNILHL